MTKNCDQCKRPTRLEKMGFIEVYYLGKKVKLIMCDECLEPHYINFESIELKAA